LLAKANGRYVTAEAGGTSPLIANRTTIGLWEKFNRVDAGTLLPLRANVNGRYVTADAGGASPLIANRTAIGPWEKLELIYNADGTVSLLADANGRYVNVAQGPLIASSTTIGPFEKLALIVNADGSLSLRVFTSSAFVRAANGGNSPLIANMFDFGPEEQFNGTTG
jgi:hypothetical protein